MSLIDRNEGKKNLDEYKRTGRIHLSTFCSPLKFQRFLYFLFFLAVVVPSQHSGEITSQEEESVVVGLNPIHSTFCWFQNLSSRHDVHYMTQSHYKTNLNYHKRGKAEPSPKNHSIYNDKIIFTVESFYLFHVFLFLNLFSKNCYSTHKSRIVKDTG